MSAQETVAESVTIYGRIVGGTPGGAVVISVPVRKRGPSRVQGLGRWWLMVVDAWLEVGNDAVARAEGRA